MAGIAGQRHGNTTAAQEESNLLAACILLDDTRGGGTQKIESGVTIKESFSVQILDLIR